MLHRHVTVVDTWEIGEDLKGVTGYVSADVGKGEYLVEFYTLGVYRHIMMGYLEVVEPSQLIRVYAGKYDRDGERNCKVSVSFAFLQEALDFYATLDYPWQEISCGDWILDPRPVIRNKPAPA